MKRKTKLIAMFMSLCLVCAVFAIGVFALKTANLKIGGDVSFSATGVEAHIKNASVSGAVTTTTLAANDAEGEVINTSMTQADIDSTFQNWQTLKLDFDENATDIELKFNIANTSTNTDNYIEIDYTYSFNNANPNVDVFPGDENAQSVWENNNYILAPKGAAETAIYETFTLKFKVLDKELNVPENTKVSVTIALKHINPAELTTTDNTNYYYNNIKYALSTESPYTAIVSGHQNSPTNVIIPALVKANSHIYTVVSFADSVFNESAISSVIIPNSVTTIKSVAFGCSGLKGIYIPNSVVALEHSTFSGCASLTSAILPTTINELTSSLFVYSGLKSIIIPQSIVKINANVFQGCTSLTSIEFKETSGWWYSTSESATEGDSLEISETNFELNAKYLKETYCDKYIFRTI